MPKFSLSSNLDGSDASEYEYVDGMTWAEFAESTYNDNYIFISGDYIYDSGIYIPLYDSCDGSGNYVRPNDLINHQLYYSNPHCD